MYDDYIDIIEFSTDEYDKTRLVPLRFKINDKWIEYDARNLNIDKLRKEIVKRDGNNKEINKFPSIKDANNEEIWTERDTYINDYIAKVQVLYGNIMDIDNNPKFSMVFEEEYDDDLDENVWKLKKGDDIPEVVENVYRDAQATISKKSKYYGRFFEWEEDKDDVPMFKSLLNAYGLIKWCAAVQIEPELSKYFKCKKVYDSNNEELVITTRDFEFNETSLEAIINKRVSNNDSIFYTSDLSLRISEDGDIDMGFQSRGGFVSLKDLISKIQRKEGETSLQTLSSEAIKQGINIEDIKNAENAEKGENEKGAIIK